MSNQEQKHDKASSQSTSLMEKQETRAMMYIIPVVIVLAAIAFLLKDIF